MDMVTNISIQQPNSTSEERLKLDSRGVKIFSGRQTSRNLSMNLVTASRGPKSLLQPDGEIKRGKGEKCDSKQQQTDPGIETSTTTSSSAYHQLFENVPSVNKAIFQDNHGMKQLPKKREIKDDSHIQTIPKKRQRYQRRNSFVVHKKRGDGTHLIENTKTALLVAQALSSLRDRGETKSLARLVLGEASSSPDERSASEEANSLQQTGATFSCGLEGQRLENSDSDEKSDWCNASWSNSDDTKWYAKLSNLTIDSDDSSNGT